MKKAEFYRRHLPHLQPLNQTFFVTWLLSGALPKSVIRKLISESLTERQEIDKYFTSSGELNRLIQSHNFRDFDSELDNFKAGYHYLRKSEIAQIVSESLHFWDKKKIDLICYCIMSNHVHAIFSLRDIKGIDEKVYLVDILESIKKYSAKECNKVLGKQGRFWQHESYDRLIRDRDELYNTINYILDNPVKAGYCKHRSSYRWSYICPEYKEFMID